MMGGSDMLMLPLEGFSMPPHPEGGGGEGSKQQHQLPGSSG
jgi:hypothetical protein